MVTQLPVSCQMRYSGPLKICLLHAHAMRNFFLNAKMRGMKREVPVCSTGTLQENVSPVSATSVGPLPLTQMASMLVNEVDCVAKSCVAAFRSAVSHSS